MTLPIRLRFHLLPQGAVWYHVDAARRHVLIDPHARARAATAEAVRPIELWHSPRWRRPPSVLVVPPGRSVGSVDRAGVVNRASVVDFIGDLSADRLGPLGALLDAVSAALRGGPPVVLVTPDSDEGAQWIGAVSFLCSPATGLQLSFSTHEMWDDVLSHLSEPAGDARSARNGAASGEVPVVRPPPSTDDDGSPGDWRTPVLSVVTPLDLDRSLDRGLDLDRSPDVDLPVVVIDPRVAMTFETVAGVPYRRTHLGQQIAITDWSRLALGLFVEDYAVVERCLRALDEVGATDGPAAEKGPWWSVDGPGPPETERPELALARAVETIAGRVDRVGGAAEDLVLAAPIAAGVLRAGPVRPAAIERVSDGSALEDYLRAVLNDDDELLRQSPPLPTAGPSDPSRGHRLRGPLTGLAHRLTESLRADGDLVDDVRAGLLLLRGVDLADRIAQLIGGPDLSGTGIERLAGRAAEVLLADRVGAAVAQIVGPLDRAALARWVLPKMIRTEMGETEAWLRSGDPVGRRLPAPVIALLAPAIDPQHRDPVTLEVVIGTATGRIAGDPRLRGPAVEYLLHRAAERYPDADPEALVAEVFAQVTAPGPWPAGALLRMIENAPPSLGAALVPTVAGFLPAWADDPVSGRLAAAVLKRIEFLPRRGPDGRPRPRRGGISEDQLPLLNLLAATGEGWLMVDDGLHRRAAEILMWGDRAWDRAESAVRQLIAPRITVAAFQAALAAEPAQSATVLHSRVEVVPVGSSWREAVVIGLAAAQPMLAQILRRNRYRLAGELVLVATRRLCESGTPDPPGEPESVDRPRLGLLPVGPVIGWLVEHEDEPALAPHLIALVDQELRAEPGDRARPVAFWQPFLPGVTDDPDTDPELRFRLPNPLLPEAVQVALGDVPATGPAKLSELLTPAAPPAPPAPPRGRWWRRWVAR